MNSSEKLLTVIVPSYNMEEYLPKCLGSLVVPDEKMLQRLDVIVVNDGSKDKTSEIAHDFERRHPGVFRVIDKENGNYGSCINAALPVAKGVFVKIVDADDSVDTTAFLQFARELQKVFDLGEMAPDLVISDFAIVDSTGNIRRKVVHRQLTPGTGHFLQEILERRAPRLALHGVTYKTDILHSINYRQTENISYTDLEWVIDPTVAVRRFAYVPLCVTKYLVGRSGQTVDSEIFIQKYQDHFIIANNLISRFELRINQSNPYSRQYYTTAIVEFLLRLYSAKIFGYPKCQGIVRCQVKGDLISLDKHVASIPLLFQKTDNARTTGAKVSIRLIHAWRHHPGRGTLPLFAFGVFCRIKAILIFLLTHIFSICRKTSV